MAKKGFFHVFFSALLAALLSFFLLYFFAPSISTSFLGVSFATRKGTDNAMVITAVEDAVDHVKNSPEFTKESLDKLQELLRSADVQAKLKAAAKQGEDMLKDAVQTVTDKVK
ncbi:MAG: hypothetical protein EOM68_16950 [Spirochaetia bacterium]|jgi:hypothetical protein|nr:hypothetical protein [Spirochaetia bacterium]